MSQSEVDIIVAGGGTAGCIIAGRLAAADPSLKILVIECGPETRNQPVHTQPARFLSHLHPESKTVKFQVGRPSEFLDGRSAIIPCGQCLGGGSSVNFVMYTRASASDYDDWETVHGNAGWGSKDLIPLIKKAETYECASGGESHGYEGPLKVSYGGMMTAVGKEFLEICPQYDPKRDVTEDPNNFTDCNKYGRWPKWIDGKKGTRSDVAHHYVYNLADHNPNLQLKTEHQVVRVVFEGKRAVGVEYVPSRRFYPDAPQKPITARARKLVVVCGGAFGSPGILERSGIGAEKVLSANGVPQIVELPGVGENYHDHQIVFTSYVAAPESTSLDCIMRNDPEATAKWDAQWHKDGSGLMAQNSIDAGIKYRPTPEELEVIGPDFSDRWNKHFANALDKPVVWIGSGALYIGDPSSVPAQNYYTIAYYLEYPAALGHVHITSANDVDAPADFDPAYLALPEDRAIMNWAYKRAREYARRLPSFRGEFAAGHPEFPAGSKAAIGTTAPVAIDAADIQYTAADEEAIRAWVRKSVATAWHALGTCSMKPREKGGVVDSQLNVYGTEGLKVADMSIAPSNVGANTYSTAVAIGEKAALIIAKELGIKSI